MKNHQRLESQPLGLDEIMIINPGSMPVRLIPLHSLSGPANPIDRPPLFLGDDGIVYALHGMEEPIRPGDFILGEYRTLERSGDVNLTDDLSEFEFE